MFSYLALLLLLSTPALAATRTSPPAGCIVVSKSPSSGQYSSLQSAITSLSTTSSGSQCVFIYPGTYTEQVYIPARTAQLTIYGSTTDTTSYQSNSVTITQGRSQDDVANNDLTATVRAWAVGLKIYNVDLVNTRGRGSQAVALSSQADRQGFYGLRGASLIGEDTVLANEGNAVYAKSYIDGATDFIFGQRQRAWFDGVDIRAKANGWITANGRDSTSNLSYYVFNKCNISAAPGTTVPTGSVYLGRPWRDHARVVFQNSVLSAIIHPAGWSVWSASDVNTENVYFREFKNTGAGAAGSRASFSGQLTAAEGISGVLGSSYAAWVDMAYLS